MPQYAINPATSTVIVSARSSMGPIAFEGRELAGWVDARVVDGRVVTEPAPTAELAIRIEALRSGNDLYDAELRRRVEWRRHPTCTVRLTTATAVDEQRFATSGDLTLHAETRHINGELTVEHADADSLVVTGSKDLDIRDFHLKAPGMLMIKIYPEVQVQLFLEAVADRTGSGTATGGTG